MHEPFQIHGNHDIVDFLFPIFFVTLLHPIGAISCHFHLLCIHTLGCVNEDLQVFIHFDAFMGIVCDVLNALR